MENQDIRNIPVPFRLSFNNGDNEIYIGLSYLKLDNIRNGGNNEKALGIVFIFIMFCFNFYACMQNRRRSF
jgi:hypothetical protein